MPTPVMVGIISYLLVFLGEDRVDGAPLIAMNRDFFMLLGVKRGWHLSLYGFISAPFTTLLTTFMSCANLRNLRLNPGANGTQTC